MTPTFSGLKPGKSLLGLTPAKRAFTTSYSTDR